MFADARQELLSFHNFVAEQLKAGDSCLSPAEALELWRLQNRTPEEFEADVQAIREALGDFDAGEVGTPVDVFVEEFRKRHGIVRPT